MSWTSVRIKFDGSARLVIRDEGDIENLRTGTKYWVVFLNLPNLLVLEWHDLTKRNASGNAYFIYVKT